MAGANLFVFVPRGSCWVSSMLGILDNDLGSLVRRLFFCLDACRRQPYGSFLKPFLTVSVLGSRASFAVLFRDSGCGSR